MAPASPVIPTARQILEHLARLTGWQQLGLPPGLARRVRQNRLLKIAREGGVDDTRRLSLHRVGEHYASRRRYAPAFLTVLPLRAAPAARSLLVALDVLRDLNATGVRKLPADAPTAFISKSWQKLVRTEQGLDRRYYELCALAELTNALRSGDRWMLGSRQFKDFEEYLVPVEPFDALIQAGELPLVVESNGEPQGGLVRQERVG